VDGYTIDATDFVDENGEPEDIEEMTVMFLKDSSKTYNQCGESFPLFNQSEFLGENKFCAVVNKINKYGGELSTSIRIYYLKDMRKPLVHLPARRIFKFQIGF
jgi:hypothetical protein